MNTSFILCRSNYLSSLHSLSCNKFLFKPYKLLRRTCRTHPLSHSTSAGPELICVTTKHWTHKQKAWDTRRIQSELWNQSKSLLKSSNKYLGYLKQRGAKSTHSGVFFLRKPSSAVKYRSTVLKDLISICRCWAWQQVLSKINWDISNTLSSRTCTSWFLEDCCRPRNLELWADRPCFRSNMFCCIHKKIFSEIPAHQEFESSSFWLDFGM